jgi:hypothetical protein
MITHPTSLSATLDSTAEAFFYQTYISPALRQEVANLIIKRQCQSGVNAGYFIPYATELESKVQLFSGEKLSTNLARNHLPMLEAVRILRLLALDSPAVAQSINIANQRMGKMCYSSFCAKGECKALTIAHMRYLLSNGSEKSTSSLRVLLACLEDLRDGKGGWGGFPFFFTLLMLCETDDSLAIQELKYAAQKCEKLLTQNWLSDPISKRRQEIIARSLARS